jgi:hypothetical protein
MDIQNTNLEVFQLLKFNILQIWIMNHLDTKANKYYFDRYNLIYLLGNIHLGLNMTPDNLIFSQPINLLSALLPDHTIDLHIKISQVLSNIAPISELH